MILSVTIKIYYQKIVTIKDDNKRYNFLVMYLVTYKSYYRGLQLKNRALILVNYEKAINYEWLTEMYNLKNESVSSFTRLQEIEKLRTLAIDILENENLLQNIDEVNYFLSSASFKHNIIVDNNRITQFHVSDDNEIDQLISKITSDLIKLFSSSTNNAIKRCLNPQCQMYFVDNSKNNSKKFCCSRCSNLIKVRRFREKKGLE